MVCDWRGKDSIQAMTVRMLRQRGRNIFGNEKSRIWEGFKVKTFYLD